MSEENKRLFMKVMEEAFNQGNLEVVDELVAPDFFNHEAPMLVGPRLQGDPTVAAGRLP